MPNRCSLPECMAISNRIHGKISVFRIPKNHKIRALWLKSLGREDWNPEETAVICEKHFDPQFIARNPVTSRNKNGRVKMRAALLAGAIPKMLAPYDPNHVPVKKIRRRRRKVKSKTKNKRKTDDLDSMPLQDRMSISATNGVQEEASPLIPIPQLKSQPLSPTKLKVTRQSSGRAQEEIRPAPVYSEEVRLRWNLHHSNMTTAFPALLSKEQYCDVTLVAEGRAIKCHRLILSSCSPYFEEILDNVVPYQHPIIFMKDIRYDLMKALCDYMYVGEVNIKQNELNLLLSVAESLKIKGLAQNPTKSSDENMTEKRKKPKFNDEITDPLDLMEKTYEEDVTDEILRLPLRRNDNSKKSPGKRVVKRKYVVDDREPSPPVFKTRRGTRSRPNVKVPRYFNTFEEDGGKKDNDQQEAIGSNDDSYSMEIMEVKTEPVDIEYTNYEENLIVTTEEPEAQIEETPPTPPPSIPNTKKTIRAKMKTNEIVADENEKINNDIESVSNEIEDESKETEENKEEGKDKSEGVGSNEAEPVEKPSNAENETVENSHVVISMEETFKE